MPAMWWVVAVVTVVVLLATYATWVAGRVDRCHARAAAAQAALDAHLVRRAAAAVAAADTLADPQLRWAGRVALEAAAEEREAAENDLTRALRGRLNGRAEPAAALSEVVAASRRVALARQVHNDLVRDALALRRRPLVRVLRLARHHPRPGYFEIDDPVLDSA
jgi:hypothetical protein